MLFWYALIRFYGFCGCYFFLFCVLFSATNLFMRMSSLPCASALPVLFVTMIPLVAIFSLPVSSIMAVRTMLGSMLARDELLFIYFSARAQAHLVWACSFFSLTLTLFFAPFVCVWAPQSYLKGKKLIIDLAKNQFHELAPGMLHTPFPGLAVSFNKKTIVNNQPVFDTLFLAFKNKDDHHFVFTAEHGVLSDTTLVLSNGSMNVSQTADYHHAQFKQCELRIHDLIEKEQEQMGSRQVKLLTIGQLWRLLGNDPHALSEFLKRIAQLVWQFIFPLISLFWVLIFPRPRGHLVRSFLFSGSLFLIMHISFALAHAFSGSLIGVLVILFGLPVTFVIGLAWKFLRVR